MHTFKPFALLKNLNIHNLSRIYKNQHLFYILNFHCTLKESYKTLNFLMYLIFSDTNYNGFSEKLTNTLLFEAQENALRLKNF